MSFIPDCNRGHKPVSARLMAPRKSTYQPHLDGLRAFAILGILWEHLNLPMPDMLRCGPLCVRFFFVLTGYFITMSLWRVRQEMANSNQGLLPLGHYYLARLLRTGPPFYLSLAVGAVFGIDEVRNNFFWIASFQANNYIAWLGYWPADISHYWSLAVQEQFYLLWPLIVLALPRSWFLPAMIGFIIFGLGFRIVCIAENTSTLARWVTLLGCIDSFAVGALIAYLKEGGWLDKLWRNERLVFIMPLVACACFFVGRALMMLPEGNFLLATTETVDAFFLAWLLSASLVGTVGWPAKFLSWAPLVYLGKISYGIYVYHVFIIVLATPLLVPMGISAGHHPWARLGILLAMTIGVASFSWHVIEQPFRAWKDSLKTSRQRTSLPAAEASAPPVLLMSQGN